MLLGGCGLVLGIAQGCDISSTTPVCDADTATTGVQNTGVGTASECVGCTIGRI